MKMIPSSRLLRKSVSLAFCGLAAIGLSSLASAADSPYAKAVKALDPLLYYQFNETSGTQAYNDGSLISVNNFITGTNSTLGAAGPVGAGFGADSHAGLITIKTSRFYTNYAGTQADLKGAIDGASALTISFWFNAETLDDKSFFVLTNGTSEALTVSFSSTNVTVSGKSDQSDTLQKKIFAADDGIGTQVWNNVVAVVDYSNATMSVYLNGMFLSTESVTGWSKTAFTVDPSATTNGPILSLYNRTDGNVLYSQAALFTKALSAEEVSNLYSTAFSAIPELSNMGLITGAVFLFMTSSFLRRRDASIR